MSQYDSSGSIPRFSIRPFASRFANVVIISSGVQLIPFLTREARIVCLFGCFLDFRIHWMASVTTSSIFFQ